MGSFLDLTALSGMWKALREIDPRAIAWEAEQMVAVDLYGAPGVGKRTLAEHLSAGRPEMSWPVVRIHELDRDGPIPPSDATVTLYVLDSTRLGEARKTHVDVLRRRTDRLLVVVTKTDVLAADDGLAVDVAETLGLDRRRVITLDATSWGDVSARLAPDVARMATDRAIALGRAMPAFRDAIASQLVGDVAKANAEFALLSSIPATIPLIGEVAALGADTVVLTKNQVMLLLKLAAVYGRPLGASQQILTEMAPVVGAAFLWRSLARNLVCLLPGPIAALPKTGVAFVGTYVVGRTAQYYYRWGKRPNREMIDFYAREGLDAARNAIPLLRRPQVG